MLFRSILSVSEEGFHLYESGYPEMPARRWLLERKPRLSSHTITTYVESASGVAEGGKSGLTYEFMKALNKKLTGSFNYYSLSGMIKEVRNLWQHSLYVTFKWLNRRSQRRSFKLERFYDIWNDRIIHPYIHVDIWSGDKVIYNKNV